MWRNGRIGDAKLAVLQPIMCMTMEAYSIHADLTIYM